MYPGAEIPTGSWNSGRSNATWRITTKTVTNHVPNARMKLRQLTLNTHLGSGNNCAITFLFVDQSTPTFFVQRGSLEGWHADDQELFLYSICWPVPEIFAIKFNRCQKSRRILDDFLPSHIFLGGPSKNVPTLSPLRLPPPGRKSFVRILLLALKLFNQSINH